MAPPTTTTDRSRVLNVPGPRGGRRFGGWTCRVCGLAAGPFDAAEAALLASLHEQVMGHPAGTAARLLSRAEPSG